MMRKLSISLFSALMLLLAAPAMANGPEKIEQTVGLKFDQVASPLSPEGVDLFGKKRRKNTFALGAVFGGPTGFGGRAVLRLGRFGIAADASGKNVRLDNGLKVGATVVKADARLYGKGILSKLVRPYIFGGATALIADFSEFEPTKEAIMFADAGVGGGIKLGRLEINGEAGLAIPVDTHANFQTGVDVFGSVAILFWLF